MSCRDSQLVPVMTELASNTGLMECRLLYSSLFLVAFMMTTPLSEKHDNNAQDIVYRVWNSHTEADIIERFPELSR